MASFASAQSEQNESVDTAVIFPASSADLAAAGLSANSDVFGDHQAALEQDNGVYGPQYPAGADAMDDLDADVPMDIQVEESMINTAQVVDAGRTEEGAGESAIHSDEAEPLDTTLQGEGKRVKVYELRDQSWHDRGTGQCKGLYDDTQDLALLVVEAEDLSGDKEGEGGFLKDELLLSTKVEKEDIYARQQDTLIVWTESSGLDVALSFQDADGCEDIWQFIMEVQRHLNNLPVEEQIALPSSSSPLSASPMLGMSGQAAVAAVESRMPWQAPTLGNIREQLQLLQMQSRSGPGRERAVEHILTEDYVKGLIAVFEQAEDLESLDDLHTLCGIMQTIIMLNDNGILEYILQDEVFEGVIGMLEYDQEYPSLKASFRQFFREISRFRQVVEIRDPSIRNKIHQTYRLQYLKEVVLARLLDDPTFGILNGFIFFNQVDIIGHIQNNDSLLVDLFSVFNTDRAGPSSSPQTDDANDQRRRDTVLFLHQLMLMGKSIQMPTRLALYRNLLDRCLLDVVEWAFRRSEAPIVHAAAEMLTLASEHDVVCVRGYIVRDEEAKRGRTLITEIIALFRSSPNLGLLSQLTDTMRTLLEPPADSEAATFNQKRDTTVSDKFINYFYDHCCIELFKPLLELPDITPDADPPIRLDRRTTAITHHLVELLYFCVMLHTQRSSFYVLSNPVNKKVVSLLYLRDKPLRLVVTRFIKCCVKSSNHFLHRSLVKNDLFRPLITMLERESKRDNMLTSACMLILDEVRKDNIKPVINYLFEHYKPRLDALAQRPFFRASIQALHARWEQINEPPPPPPPQVELDSQRWSAREKEAQQEDYFNGSDDDEKSDSSVSTSPVNVTTTVSPVGKRKRFGPSSSPNKRMGKARTSEGRTRGQGASSSTALSGSTTGTGGGSSSALSIGTSALGLDYDDNSDSDSAGGSSPRAGPSGSRGDAGTTGTTRGDGDGDGDGEMKPTAELAEDLGDVAMQMRLKRQREEEEDEGEGFAGLLVKAKQVSGAPLRGSGNEDDEDGGGGGGGEETKGKAGAPVKRKVLGFGGDREKDKEKEKVATGHKVKLNWGPLKKFTMGASPSGKKSSAVVVDGKDDKEGEGGKGSERSEGRDE